MSLARVFKRQEKTGGRVVDVRFHSRVMGCWRDLAAWIPPDYERNARRLPVVYLFRGHHTEWQRRYVVRGGYHVLAHLPALEVLDLWRVMDTLVRSGAVRPMIVVTPCMANHDGALTGLATDWIAPERVSGRRLRGVGTGQFGTHLVHEIIPLIDRTFRTIGHRDGRATDGFSLGGFMSLKLALSQAHLFKCAGAYDGSFLYLHHRPGGDEEGDYLLNNHMFDPVFDLPRRADHVFQNSPAAILARSPDSLLRSMTFHLQSGPQQAEPSDSNFYRTMHVVRLLQMRGVLNQADPFIIEDGHHDWPTAFKHLAQSLQCFSRVLAEG